MSFSIIAVVGKNRELGKNGKLLWHLPGDLKFFKETTMGHPVLMGHRTFDSLPGLLPGRKHYVLTRNTEIDNAPDQVVLVNNLVDFVDNAPDEEFFVIGGGMVYWEMLKHCDKIYLTEVEAEDPEADTFFPEFDLSKYSREVLGEGEDKGIKYVFALYKKEEEQ